MLASRVPYSGAKGTWRAWSSVSRGRRRFGGATLAWCAFLWLFGHLFRYQRRSNDTATLLLLGSKLIQAPKKGLPDLVARGEHRGTAFQYDPPFPEHVGAITQP